MTACLELIDVAVTRGGRRVVRGVSLQVGQGEVAAVLGPNGAGRSSLLEAVAGVLPRSGHVSVDGVDVRPGRPEAARRAGIAIAREGHPVLRRMTVRENLEVAATHSASALEQATTSFPDLGERLGQPAGLLSGGQQQMLSIALALAGAPRVLLIDELSLGLAPAVVAGLAPVIRSIADQGVAVVLVEQFASVALSIADHAYVMRKGEVVHGAPAADLRGRQDFLHELYLGELVRG